MKRMTMRGVVLVLAMVLASRVNGEPVPDAEVFDGEGATTSGAVGDVTTTLAARSPGEDSIAEVVEALTTWRDEEEAHRPYEEALGVCLRERGFEYTPRPYVPLLPAALGSAFVPLDERRGFMEEFGYGLTTLYWERERARLDHMGVDGDPNEARVAAMSDTEREAYEDAILGERTGEMLSGTEGGEWAERDRDGSCSAEALEATRTGFDRDALSDRTQQALDEVYERVAADPVVLAATEAWYRCMAEAGHPLDDVAGEMGSRYAYLTGEELAYRVADRLLQRALRWVDVDVPRGDGSVYSEQFPEFNPETLAEAQAEELRIAAVDLACDEETERSATLIAARDRIHAEVVATNLADFLEALDG